MTRGSLAVAAALAAIVAAGCLSEHAKEVLFERLDPITGERLELYVEKWSQVDDRPLDMKTLKVRRADGATVIYVEKRDRMTGQDRLQVNRAGAQSDASPDDWAQYRNYLRNFDATEMKAGPAKTRRGE